MGRLQGRTPATIAALALLAAALLAAAARPARADVPAVYRVCASVPWKAPSLEQQRRHLGRNPRWSPADRNDPGPALDFPFIVRIRSGSISFDQDELGGMWTLGRRAVRRLARCPFTGGPRRNFELWLKGWQVQSVRLTDAGDLAAVGRPQPGVVQALHFPGYGNRDGAAVRRVTLERSDAPGCAISSWEGLSGTYGDVNGTGLSCADVLDVLGEIDENVDWAAPDHGFSCAQGDASFGQRLSCADGSGRTLRFDFSDGTF